MFDMEKVIKGLHCCAHMDGINCIYCPYDNTGEDCTALMSMDVLELLKEQEPILLKNQHKPYGISTNANSPWISRCPRCGKKIEGKQTRFCKYCGQKVKWDEQKR